MALPNPFPVARYRFEFEIERPLALPEYAGSALRGVFGHALKKIACVTREPECKSCTLYRSCLYPAIFECPPPHGARRTYSEIPQPFVVEPPPWGERGHGAGNVLNVDTVLIGPALPQLPVVTLAWQKALSDGIGPIQGTARLRRVWVEGHADPILTDPRGRLIPHQTGIRLPKGGEAPQEVLVELSTPLRLKRDGDVLRVAQLTPKDLLMGLVRRISDITELHLGEKTEWDFAALKRSAAAVEGEKHLEWRDWSRYSQRQHQSMTLGGAVGSWRLRGDLTAFWPLLHLGQWLHVGGKATFGLGQYRVLASAPT
ncbi:MAG: CRISPR system precrRNA processing endoribonuclease RAMP protein Cas6 [Burkholderiales bacterium]|nr:CRISPR system precrRNA processing endoribonuclease RAMP protein Cas6 [Burkholderiales bacterium]